MDNKILEVFKITAAQVGRLCGLLVRHGIITEAEGFWVINGDDDDQVNAPKLKGKEVNNGEDG